MSPKENLNSCQENGLCVCAVMFTNGEPELLGSESVSTDTLATQDVKW